MNDYVNLSLSLTMLFLSLYYSFIFQLTFARFYMPAYLPEADKAIYLDDDVIVQGKAGWTATFHSELASRVSAVDPAAIQEKYLTLFILFFTQETFRSCLKPKSDQDMRLHSQMTVTQRPLKALSEELEIRFSTIFVKKSIDFLKILK